MEDQRYQPSEEELSINKPETGQTLPEVETSIPKPPERIPGGMLGVETTPSQEQPDLTYEHIAEDAVELVNERRHEVKDQTKPQQAATPIGEVVAGAAVRQPGLSSMPPPTTPRPQPVQTSLQSPNQVRWMYRRAILAGFTFGLILFAAFGLYIFYK